MCSNVGQVAPGSKSRGCYEAVTCPEGACRILSMMLSRWLSSSAAARISHAPRYPTSTTATIASRCSWSVRGRRGAETPGGDPFRALAGPTLGRGEKRGGAGWTVATGPSYNRRALATSIGREPVADQASAWRPGNEAAHSHEGAGTAVIVAGCPGTTHRLKGSYLYEPENRYQSGDRLLWRHGRRFARAPGRFHVEGCGLFIYVHDREGEQHDSHAQLAGVVLPDVGAVMVGGAQWRGRRTGGASGRRLTTTGTDNLCYPYP